METISLSLQENNLAEVLAGVGILGILQHTYPEQEFPSVWEDSQLKITSEITEADAVNAVLDFLRDIRWVQAHGDVHQGVFKARNLLGLDFLLSPSAKGEPSIYKNFSGQVSGEKITAGLVECLPSKPVNEFSELLGFTTNNQTSWGIDWRTNGHSLDIGYSANDDGTSRFDPVYVCTELLGLTALSFFMNPWVNASEQDSITYSLWRTSIPAHLSASALAGLMPGLPDQTFRTSRRGKSYGKGASYRYYPPAIPLHQ
jgi:hypothetical protein